MILFLFLAGFVCSVSATPADASRPRTPHVVMMVIDDLGYADLGFLNGGLTSTPNLDALATKDGMTLTQSYAFTLCSPSRASLLSGRENWRIGWYTMFPPNQGGKETPEKARCLAKYYQLLPDMLRNAGYSTHAIGKWDVGMISKNCTATNVGFDSFLGYYEASLESYWTYRTSKCGGARDLSFSVRGSPAQPVESNVYSTELFTQRAQEIIKKQNQTAPLFLYLAYQAVHMGDGNKIGGRQASCKIVDTATHAPDDKTKVMASMISELDENVGRVVESIKQSGMWNDTVLIVLSDNGGKLGPRLKLL
jgi:arylsulfatase A-like enzyme